MKPANDRTTPPYTQSDQSPSINAITVFLLSLLFFILHCILQFILYHGRFHRWPLCGSDWIVLGLPNVLSLFAYALLMERWIMPKKIHAELKILCLMISTLLLQFFSWWGSLLIPINTYGS